MKKYIFKLHFAGTKTLTFARELTREEYELIRGILTAERSAGILTAERSAGILNGYVIKEVESFESTY